MAALAMSVATGIFFSTYVCLRVALGSCPGTSLSQTSMWSGSRVSGMRCNVTRQYRSRPEIASPANMVKLVIQAKLALKTRSTILTEAKKIKPKILRTEAPSFQAISRLASFRVTTASSIQITTTGQLSTPARHILAGSKLLRGLGF